jgi:ComF family protein
LAAITLKQSSECIGCKIQTPHGLICSTCRPRWALDQLCIAAPYDHPTVKRAIHAFKYQCIEALAVPLAEVAHTYIKDRTRHGLSLFAANPIVISVPMTPRRLNWRGFNQSELIAHRIAAMYHMGERHDILKRTGRALQQARTTHRHERFENIAGHFECAAPDAVRGRDILIVDDVCTTGATLNECARVLKSSGARAVAALVLARG